MKIDNVGLFFDSVGSIGSSEVLSGAFGWSFIFRLTCQFFLALFRQFHHLAEGPNLAGSVFEMFLADSNFVRIKVLELAKKVRRF